MSSRTRTSAGLAVLAVFASTAFGIDKPNVVLIYSDDVGFADVGAYGAKKIPTPKDWVFQLLEIFEPQKCS